MSVGKITIEGTAQFSAPSISCICEKCGDPSNENSTVVFDFKQKKVIYLCGNPKCKKMNEINLNVTHTPYPKSRFSK